MVPCELLKVSGQTLECEVLTVSGQTLEDKSGHFDTEPTDFTVLGTDRPWIDFTGLGSERQ